MGAEAMMAAEDALRPPTEAEVAQALERYAADVRAHYGDKVRGIYLFGSRARGDHRPDSDADVAVILADSLPSYWQVKMQLADMTYDVIEETGAYVQGWPVSDREWRDPELHPNPSVVRAMRRDGVPLWTAV